MTFNDIIEFEDFDIDNFLVDEKSHGNILTQIGPKPLRIRFNLVDGFISIYDGSRYLVLFSLEKYDAFYNRIRYSIDVKSGITYVFSHYGTKINVHSYDSLPPEKVLTFHNVIILIKSVLNKDQTHYYYNIFLEKCLHRLAKKLMAKMFLTI